MNPFSWLNYKIKHFRWQDISLIKVSTAAFILLVAKLFPVVLSLHWAVYALIAVVAAIPPFMSIIQEQRYHCQECGSNPCECGAEGPQVRM